MPTTKDDIKNSYPVPVFHYHVEIDGIDAIAFSEVSGLSIERETITYKDGLSCKEGPKHMPGISTPVKLTMKKGIVKSDSKLYDWINSINITTVDKKNITISLMDESGDSPVVSWKVTDAFPTKLEAPSFNATSNEVAIESMELTADDLKLEYS
jgi:phage tail-like protein